MPTTPTAPPRVSVPLGLALMLALALCTALVLRAETPAAPAPATADGAAFSTARALVQLARIARAPHPLGTPENAVVRGYLLDQLTTLGLAPTLQSGIGKRRDPRLGVVGQVHNIVARLPGRAGAAGRPALMLAAHYDSGPGGNGAADDGASVAAILDTLRALKTGPPLANDVIVLFTDGEEAGLLGSELFVRLHPWAKQVGLVLNFDYRGNSGPMMLFETSVGNGALVSGFGHAAALPVGNSLLYEVYKLLPNDTDMTSFKRAGMAGLNFAAIGGMDSYHTERDRVDQLAPSTLQHQGATMLALTRHFGNVALDQLTAGDRVYFDVPGFGLVDYPVALVWPLTALTLGLLALVLVRARAGGHARLWRTVAGAVAFGVSAILLAIVCQLLWLGAATLHTAYRAMPVPYNSHWYVLAYALLVPGLYVLAQQAFRRWITPVELGLGALLCWLILLVVCSAAVPGVSFVFTWPLLALLGAMLWLFSARAAGMSAAARASLLALALVPGVVIFAPLVYLLFIGLTPHASLAPGLMLALFAGLMTPLLTLLTGRLLVPALPLAGGVALLAAGSLTAGSDLAHPRQNNLYFAQDAAAGAAYWISQDSALDAWTSQFFPAHATKRTVPGLFGASPRLVFAASTAPLAQLEAPRIDVLGDVTGAGGRTVSLRIQSGRAAYSVLVNVDGAAVLNARVQGQPFSDQPVQKWTLQAVGMGNAPLDLRLQLAPGTPFKVRVTDETPGLPQAGFGARGRDMMPTMYGSNTDTTRVVQTRAF